MNNSFSIVIIVAVLVTLGLIALVIRRRPRTNKTVPTAPAKYEELQEDVRAAVKEIDSSIALISLCRRFNEDDRIADRYNNTYEAHPYVLCRSSIEYSLALALIRCHDHRKDSHGLTGFFDLLEDNATMTNLRGGILNRRREHVDEADAVSDTEDHMVQIEEARKLHSKLRGSHQYARVKAFRHSFVAHRTKETENVQPTKINYMYELADSSTEVVDLLAQAVLGSHESFGDGVDVWEGYAGRFFDIVMAEPGTD